MERSLIGDHSRPTWGLLDVAELLDEAAAGFAARIPIHSCALSIQGPPGIGKTHHWSAIVDAAVARSWRVLSARPGETGSRLFSSALTDLVADVTDDEIDALPTPQRRALLAALRRDTAEGPAPDRHIVAVALATLAARLSDAGPVLLAVDDLQWLDPTTGEALAHVASQLPTSNLGFVVTLRTPTSEPALLTELDVAWVLRRVDVPPMDPAGIAELVRAQMDFAIPTWVVTKAVQASEGNPFYAIELARMWASDAIGAVETQSMPESMQELAASRVRRLPSRTRLALATASAIGRARMADLAGLALADAVPAAEQAQIVTVDDDVVRFTHPLLAAAAYNDVTKAERMGVHRRVANIVADVEQRARHLALASPDATDAVIAALLDEATASAELRADINAALDAARLAVRMTPTSEPADERRLTVGRLLFKLGNAPAAEAELAKLLHDATSRRVRVRAFTLLSELTFATVSPAVAAAHGEAAVAAALPGADDDLLADAHLRLAQCALTDAEIRAHAATALALVDAGARAKPAAHAIGLAVLAGQDFFSGKPFAAEPFERALAVEEAGGVIAEDSMTGYYLAVLGYSDEVDAAFELADRWERRCIDEGCESQAPFILMWRSHLLLKSGRLEAAASVINRHIALCERLGQDYNGRFGQVSLGRLAMLRGDLAAARKAGEALTAHAVAIGTPVLETRARRLVGEAALYGGDYAVAAEHLRRIDDLLDSARADAYSVGHRPYLAEAYIALGQPALAEELLDQFGQLMHRSCSASGLSAAALGEGLLSAARGDEQAAIGAVDRALAGYGRPGFYPFEHSRTLLVKGQMLRRARRKAHAKQVLLDARAAFDAIGAVGWVAQTEDELTRIGIRPAAPTGLTPTERKIIQMIGTGTSSRDVAAALYLSPRTVEGHLVRIYRKVGVRNRAELIARHAAGQLPAT